MVSFTNIPYSEALKIGIKQEKIMKKIMKTPNIDKIWENDKIVKRMLEYCDDY